jgi:RNA binding exosome subunit
VFLNVRLRAFCHATEDLSKVRTAIEFLLPDCTISEKKTTGHHGNPIVVLETRARRKPEIRDFWNRMKDSISPEVLMSELDSRIDGECVLHVRLDKQKAYQGKMQMVKHEDVISVSSKIESYPRKRETALKNAEDYFESKG